MHRIKITDEIMHILTKLGLERHDQLEERINRDCVAPVFQMENGMTTLKNQHPKFGFKYELLTSEIKTKPSQPKSSRFLIHYYV